MRRIYCAGGAGIPAFYTPSSVGTPLAEGKVIALVTCTIHSTEVGSTQMAMEFVWQFATTDDPRQTAWMDDVVLLLIDATRDIERVKDLLSRIEEAED